MHCAMKSRLPKQGMPRWSPMKGYLQMFFTFLLDLPGFNILARVISCWVYQNHVL